MMSLKTMPGFGKSGTSRILPRRSRALIGSATQPHVAPEEELRELLRELGERLQVLEPGLAALGVARAERRRDELLEQRRLPVGGGAERAQVAGVDAEAREPPARRGDLRVALAVEALAALEPRLQQPELLELAREVAGRCRRGRRARRARARPRSSPSPACAPPRRARRRRRRRELLADHPQRQELVALQAQDRLQPLDVVLAEQPVAAAGPLRRQQALILEVADLRDRDVRELVAAGARRPRRS